MILYQSRILLLSALVACALLEPAWCAQKLEHYVGAEFSFDYPSGWSVFKSTKDGAVLRRASAACDVAVGWEQPQALSHPDAHRDLIFGMRQNILGWVWREVITRNTPGGGLQTELSPSDAKLIREGNRQYVTSYFLNTRLLYVFFCSGPNETTAGPTVLRTLAVGDAPTRSASPSQLPVAYGELPAPAVRATPKDRFLGQWQFRDNMGYASYTFKTDGRFSYRGFIEAAFMTVKQEGSWSLQGDRIRIVPDRQYGNERNSTATYDASTDRLLIRDDGDSKALPYERVR